jgi:hypothetical protein
MSECKYREVRLNCFQPQDISLMEAENVGVADGPRMTVES